MTECRLGCGACCDPVQIPWTQAEAVTLPIDPRDRFWMLEMLTPMSRREAKAKMPHLFDGRPVVDANKRPVFPMFYSCRAFDPETRLCTAHELRPPICSGFPWYDEAPKRNATIPPQCEFNRDVGREPVMVEITAKP